MRLCDLGLKLERTPLADRTDKLYEELKRCGIRHKPHVWLSSEWFSPDGIPGIAIPFYLAHPRLRKLEHRQILEVEGGTEGECMRILRHEAGHAIDTAYRLHRRKRWRKHYRNWYAALRKLEYVDELMEEIAGQPAAVRSRAQVYPMKDLTLTLRRHYKKKRAHYALEWDEYYDRDLARLFSNDKRYAARPTAASFLRGNRKELRERIAEWTGAHVYTVDQVLQDLIDRSREKKLRLAMPPNRARREAVMLVTVHTMNCMHWTRREIPL